MIGWLRQQRTAHAVPSGRRVYAVGDIHGRLDLLDDLLRRIETDCHALPEAKVEIVFLGDYVDRGPDSFGVLDRLASRPPAWARWTLLKGNHEDVMLSLLTNRLPDARLLEMWLLQGGLETLASYDVPAAIRYSDSPERIIAALRENMPPTHVELLHRMALYRRIGDYLFVHAGVRPGVPLTDQAPQDLMWIRHEFLDCEEDHGCIIVHGHSITPLIDERPNRIGIDTGAYMSDCLTALALEGATRRTLSTCD